MSISNRSAQDCQRPGCFSDDWQVSGFTRLSCLLSFSLFIFCPDKHSLCCQISHFAKLPGKKDLRKRELILIHSPLLYENHSVATGCGCSYFIHGQEAERNGCKQSTSILLFIQFRIPFHQKLLPTFTIDHPSQLSHVETPSRASWWYGFYLIANSVKIIMKTTTTLEKLMPNHQAT